MSNEGIEVEVYSFDDPLNYLATIDGRRSPTYLEEIGANGAGSFQVPKSDRKITAHPDYLQYRNRAKIKVNGETFGSFIIGKKRTTVIDTEGSEAWSVNGEGLKIWFDDCDVKPLGGLKKDSLDTRSFSFASEQGDWYNAADWDTPVVIANLLATPWAGEPQKWPEGAPDAEWVWGEAYVGSAPIGSNYFRYEFTTASGPKTYRIYAAADDTYSIWVDGQRLMTSDPRYSATKEPSKVDITLGNGPHVLAFRSDNRSGVAGLIAAMFTIVGEVETLVTYTGDTGWEANPYPTVAPGWSAGEVLLTLMEEGGDRGVESMDWLTPTFTATLDSNGEAWDSVFDWTFDIGESLLSVVGKLEELACDIWIDPDTLELNMVNKGTRATDRSEGPNSIIFRKGKNLRQATSEGVGKIKNSLTVRTEDGWLEVDNQDIPSISIYGTLEGKLDTNASEAISKSLALVIFEQRATAEEGASYEIVVSKYIPGVDFFVEDWVMAPNDLNVLTKRKVVSISLEESDGGKPLYNLEFDTIFRDTETRIARFLNRTSGGSIGTSYNNSSPSGQPINGQPIITVPSAPSARIPKAPTGLTASSGGLWSADGVTALSEVTFDWDAVTQNIDNTSTTPTFYELWIKQTADSDDSYQQFALVPANTALVTLIAGYEGTAKVRALNSGDEKSIFSATFDFTADGPITPMDAPDDPTLTTALGSVTATWTGLLLGNTPPPQFRYVFAEIADDVGGPYTRRGATLSRDGRNILIPDLSSLIDEEVWVKLYSVDGANNISAASGAVSITVEGIGLADLGSVAEYIAKQKESLNLLNDASFELNTQEFWDWDETQVTNVTTDPRTGARHLRLETTTVAYEALRYTRALRCDPGENLLISIYAVAEATTAEDSIEGGIELSVLYDDHEDMTSATSAIIGLSQELLVGDYEALLGQWAVPAGALWFKPVIKILDTSDDNVYYLDDARILRMTGQTTLVDGAVVADKIAADAVTAGKIAADAVSATNIQAEAVTSDKIAADAITANKIAANAITADKILAGTVNTSHIAPGFGDDIDISLNGSLTIMAGRVDGVEDDLNSTSDSLQEMQTYYSFSGAEAVISTPASPFSVAIDATSIEMRENGNPVSYWNAGTFYVNQLVGTIVVVGNHQLEPSGARTVIKAL